MREAVSTFTSKFEKSYSAQQVHHTMPLVSDYDYLRMKNKYYFFHLCALLFQMSTKLFGPKYSINCLILPT